MQWFAVGLGIPLLGLALVSGLNTSSKTTPLPRTPIIVATASDELVSPGNDENVVLTTVDLIAPKPESPPAPEYDTLTLTIRSGDTLGRYVISLCPLQIEASQSRMVGSLEAQRMDT